MSPERYSRLMSITEEHNSLNRIAEKELIELGKTIAEGCRKRYFELYAETVGGTEASSLRSWHPRYRWLHPNRPIEIYLGNKVVLIQYLARGHGSYLNIIVDEVLLAEGGVQQWIDNWANEEEEWFNNREAENNK